MSSGKFKHHRSELSLYFEPRSVQSHQWLGICLNITAGMNYNITPVLFTKGEDLALNLALNLGGGNITAAGRDHFVAINGTKLF